MSSGAIRVVKDTCKRPGSRRSYSSGPCRGRDGSLVDFLPQAVLEQQARAGSGESGFALYGATKFVQLLGAHWWRRHLAGHATVIAVSPGLIPGTGLGRGFEADGIEMPSTVGMKDAKSVPEGARLPN